MASYRSSQLLVTFYLPFSQDGVTHLPDRIEDYWPWLLGNSNIKDKGKYSWTLQTYLQLRTAGFNCRISERFPPEGVVIAHRDFLPVILLPRTRVFLICIKPDRKRHTWAHAYIVQNERDKTSIAKTLRRPVLALPYWPQPSLIPRNTGRGDRCENIAYIGRPLNLAPELRTSNWVAALTAMGFNWSISEFDQWHNYASVDVTVSIRSFSAISSPEDPIFSTDTKPPSKLVNSWLAGVPAILGVESAYRNIRKSPLDYIEAGNTQDVRDALLKLRSDTELYQAMIQNGLDRAAEYSPEAIRKIWVDMLETQVPSWHLEWAKKHRLHRALDSFRSIIGYFSEPQNIKDLSTILKH